MALTQTEWVHAFLCNSHQNIEDIYIINYINYVYFLFNKIILQMSHAA